MPRAPPEGTPLLFMKKAHVGLASRRRLKVKNVILSHTEIFYIHEGFTSLGFFLLRLIFNLAGLRVSVSKRLAAGSCLNTYHLLKDLYAVVHLYRGFFCFCIFKDIFSV